VTRTRLAQIKKEARGAMTARLTDWIGQHETQDDVLHAQPSRFMQATLDREPSLEDGDALPPLWHWLYFLSAKPMRALGRDGHPAKGGFLPPIELPRRMWAGGRFAFNQPLVLGQPARKQSTILKVTEKEGRSGQLCFVTVEHCITQYGAVAVREEHDIVYLDDPSLDAKPVPTVPTLDHADFSETVQPSEVLLYRYSALTFNGHRIHYDSDYARGVEGYDGLVFHGPLTATLLVDLAMRHVERTPTAFEFRGTAPISGPAAFHIEGRQTGSAVELWARRGDGACAMTAQAIF